MPDISVSAEQVRRLESVASDLEAVYVGEYGHVRHRDALEYLLDTYTPPSEIAETDPYESSAVASESHADTPASDQSPEETLQQAMDLLSTHADKWREGSGDEPYEVDLPDGSTEAVRTKDDIKRLLFTHWKD